MRRLLDIITWLVVLVAMIVLIIRDRRAARMRQKSTGKLKGSDRDVS